MINVQSLFYSFFLVFLLVSAETFALIWWRILCQFIWEMTVLNYPGWRVYLLKHTVYFVLCMIVSLTWVPLNKKMVCNWCFMLFYCIKYRWEGTQSFTMAAKYREVNANRVEQIWKLEVELAASEPGMATAKPGLVKMKPGLPKTKPGLAIMKPSLVKRNLIWKKMNLAVWAQKLAWPIQNDIFVTAAMHLASVVWGKMAGEGRGEGRWFDPIRVTTYLQILKDRTSCYPDWCSELRG